MAMDYEVRPEYEDLSLSELLDTSVMCFQGVGDTQHDILSRFFAVETVRDLANLSYFISALGIQEQALKQESNGHVKVSDLARTQPLKFAVRPEYLDQTAEVLLSSPIRVLDALTPAQTLALYDAFRITNVVQLAQNRIMLEARIIEYLQKVQSGEIPEADMNTQIASILLSSGLPDTGEARRPMAHGEGEGDPRSLTGSLAVHLRERLEVLRERAREKAGEIAGRPTSSAEERSEEAGRVRPGARMDARSRMESIRESRLRSDAAASTAAGRSGAEAVSSVIAARDATMADLRARRAEGTAVAGRTPPRPGTGGRTPTSTTRTTTSAAGARPAAAAAATAEGEEAAKGAAAEAPPAAGRGVVLRRGPDPRLLLVAAAVILLIAGGIWVWIRSTEPPAVVTTVTEQPQPGQEQPGAAGQPGAEPGPQVAAVAPRAETPAVSGPEVLPIKTIHTVSWGQSLWRISRSYYQNPEKWPWIHRANRDQISNPDLIYPKQRLKIPELKR